MRIASPLTVVMALISNPSQSDALASSPRALQRASSSLPCAQRVVCPTGVSSALTQDLEPTQSIGRQHTVCAERTDSITISEIRAMDSSSVSRGSRDCALRRRPSSTQHSSRCSVRTGPDRCDGRARPFARASTCRRSASRLRRNGYSSSPRSRPARSRE